MEALFGTILGALIAGVAAYLVMKKQLGDQTAGDKKKFFLRRLEQIYEISADTRDLYRKSSGEVLRYIAVDQTSKSWEEGKVIPLQRLKMLVAFYTPQLNGDIQNIEELSVSYGDAIPDALKSSIGSDAFVAFQSVYRQLDQALESIQNQIAELSKNYTGNFFRNR
jgi:hypothetical protein